MDARPRIGAVLDQTLARSHSGLVTLERARLADGQAGQHLRPGGRDEQLKLTVYLGRQERVYRVPAFVAVCDLLRRRGVAGATALLGVDGTTRGRRQRARFFSRNAQVPMMVVAVGSGEQIRRVTGELGALLARPVITLERVRVLKRDGHLLGPLPARPGAGADGCEVSPAGPAPLTLRERGSPPRQEGWRKLTIYTSEAALHRGQPIHRALTRGLRSAGVSGATTLRGVWGFHGDHAPHGDRLLRTARHVPAVTIVVEAPERVPAALAVIDELTSERGLVTSEIVPAFLAAADSRNLGRLGADPRPW